MNALGPPPKDVIDLAHEHGKLYVLHACGNLTEVMASLIDFVGIDYDNGIDFIEVKSGRARFTEDEIKLKDLIECKMVNYVSLTVRRISIAEEIPAEEIPYQEEDEG